MHTLSIAHILVYFAEYEQYIKQDPLRLGFPKIRFIWHTAFNILEDFRSNFFVLSQCIPRGLEVSVRWTPVHQEITLEGFFLTQD